MMLNKLSALAVAGVLSAGVTSASAAMFTISYSSDPNAPYGGAGFQPGFSVSVEATETANTGLFEVTKVLELIGSSYPYASTGHMAPNATFQAGTRQAALFRSDGSFLDTGFCFNDSGLANACGAASVFYRLNYGGAAGAYFADSYRYDPFSVGFFEQSVMGQNISIIRTSAGGSGTGGSGTGGTSGGSGTGGGSSAGGGSSSGGGTGSPAVPSAVPLPASVLMLLSAVLGIGMVSRRRTA